MKLFLLKLAFAPIALQVTAASIWDDPMILFYTVVGFIFLVAILVLIVSVYLLQIIRQMTKISEQELAKKRGVEWAEQPGLIERFIAWTNRSVPVEKEETILLDHNYDGIKELDNHLPPWWKWLFVGTVIWGAFYLFSYHVINSMPLQTAEYETELTVAAEQARLARKDAGESKIDETNVTVTAEVVALQDGKETFQSICASCHKADGGGDIGPNLTDAYWKHGGDIKSIFKVVQNGVTGTNMVAWGASMSPEKIRNVSSYLLTLQGTNPPNGKKPEGDLYVPEQPVAKQDSTVVK